MTTQRIKELEAENAELDKLAVSRWNTISDLQDVIGRLTAENERLQAENKALRKVFDATWEALDGLYGADMGEVIPVTLLPEDRQRLFNRVLEVVGETGVMEMLEEEGK